MTNVFNKGDLIVRLDKHKDSFWETQCERRNLDPNGQFTVAKYNPLTVWIEGFDSEGWAPLKFELVPKVIDLDEDDQDCI